MSSNGFHFLCLLIICCTYELESRSVREVRSDVIVTKFGPERTPTVAPEGEEEEEPGWMRRTLLKFGKVTSRIGNALGTHATKITSAVERVCEVVKTIIPLLAAICHVGQFQFCSATSDAPAQIQTAISTSNLDLDIPD